MKVVLLLLLLTGLAHCQFGNFHGFAGQNLFSQSNRDPNVHQLDGNSQYHFSWKVNPGRVFKGHEAASYCRGLGSGWNAVAISSRQENTFISGIFNEFRNLDYIWTGGVRQGNGFAWSNGESFRNFNDWSPTGGTPTRRRQPDNREGNENCLAVLKNIYRDGLKWHDVGCGHKKPVVCEKH